MVLVTGGTGLVGSHLLLHLMQKQVPTRALYRSRDTLAKVRQVFGYYTGNASALFEKIEWIQGDILDIPSLEEAFYGISKVYHCAAYISFDPSEFNTLEKINKEGTANVVNLCIDRKVKKLCHVSTIGAIGKNVNQNTVDEESAWSFQNTNPYAITKYLAEMEVWRGAQEGLSMVIVNPGVILGPGFWDTGSGTFFKTAAKEYNYYPPGGSGFIGVTDVVSIMVQLMESDIEGERFITVAENLSYKEALQTLAIAMDKKPPQKMLKIWQLQVFRFFDWLKNILMGGGRTVTKNTIYGLKNPVQFSTDKLKKALGFKFEPLQKTIKFCADLFIEEST